MPKKSPPSPPPVDLDIIDDYLISDDAPENCMSLSDLDGYLTGLAVGPEAIKPSEWMPLIWGGEEPDFSTLAQADAVLGNIIGRYNQILAHFDTDPDNFDPVFWEGPEGEVVVADWAAGFMDAVTLRAKAWEPILKDEEGLAIMLPLLVLGSEEDRPLFDAPPLLAEELEKLLEDGADIIMEIVPAIHEFWRNHQG